MDFMVGNNKIIHIDSITTPNPLDLKDYLQPDGSFNSDKLTEVMAKYGIKQITLPSKFIKTNCILRVESQGNFFYLDWDLNQKAPVSEFMDASDWVVYMDEWYKDYLPKEGLEPIYPIVYVAMAPQYIDMLICDNHAGPEGKTLTWSEIIDHYGNSMKNRVPVPINQDEDTGK